MRPEGLGQQQRCFPKAGGFLQVNPNPIPVQRSSAQQQRPAVIARFPFSFPPVAPRSCEQRKYNKKINEKQRKTNGVCTRDRRKIHSSAGPARSPLPRPPSPTPPQGGQFNHFQLPSLPGGTRYTALPTFVLRREARTAKVALSPA